ASTGSLAAAASSAAFSAFVLRGLRAGFSGFSAGGGSVTATFDSFSNSFSDMWLPSLQSRRDLAPQRLDSLSGDRGAGHQVCRADREIARRRRPAQRQLVVGQFVALGEDDALVDAGRTRPLVHLTIFLARGSPRVEQQKD